MVSRKPGLLEGWPLLGVLALAVSAMAAAIVAAQGGDVEGVRAAIRATARSSAALFCLAFAAGALVKLWPGAATRWLKRNRRIFGLAFAVSHGVHALAIAAYAILAPAAFAAHTMPATWIFGGLAYAFIIAMAATSFDRSAAWIGPRAWRILHAVGAYYLWISFINNFGRRAIAEPNYWGFVAVLLLVGALKLAAAFWPTPPAAAAAR